VAEWLRRDGVAALDVHGQLKGLAHLDAPFFDLAQVNGERRERPLAVDHFERALRSGGGTGVADLTACSP